MVGNDPLPSSLQIIAVDGRKTPAINLACNVAFSDVFFFIFSVPKLRLSKKYIIFCVLLSNYRDEGDSYTKYFGQTWSASMIWQMHSFKDVQHQISESLEFCDVYSIYFDVCIYMCMYTCIKRRCACHVHISHYMVTIAIWQSMFVRIHLFFFCVVWLRLWLVVLVVLLTWSVRSSRRGSNTRSATTKSTTKQEQNADNMEAYLRFFLMVMLELFRNMFFFEGMGKEILLTTQWTGWKKSFCRFFWGQIQLN